MLFSVPFLLPCFLRYTYFLLFTHIVVVIVVIIVAASSRGFSRWRICVKKTEKVNIDANVFPLTRKDDLKILLRCNNMIVFINFSAH